MANAGVATAAEAVRVEAAEIMLADHDGDMDASLAHRDLMLVHPGSVVVYRLLRELQYAAATRAARSEGSSEDHLSAAVPHLRVALEVLTAACRLAPDCIDVGPPFSSPTALPSLPPRSVRGVGRWLGGGPGWQRGSWRLAPGRRSARLARPRRPTRPAGAASRPAGEEKGRAAGERREG
jgi:hypothetical protein